MIKLEKPEIKNTIGAAIAPINLLCVLNSTNKWVIEIPQLKKINDSYKLLKGKYPSLNHLKASVITKIRLLTTVSVLLTKKADLFVGKAKLIQ